MVRPEIGTARGHRGREAFVALPYELHRDLPGWTPPLRRDARAVLDPARNPFYDHAERELFLARRGGRVVGRIAAIHDRLHEATHRDRVGFFGFFESVDDPAVAIALIEAAAGWARGRGRDTLRGPVNPSINDEAGLLVDGFDTPSVLMMPHNPCHYPALLEATGLRKAKDLLAFQRAATELPERLVAATRGGREAVRHLRPPDRHATLPGGGRPREAPLQRGLGAELGLRAARRTARWTTWPPS